MKRFCFGLMSLCLIMTLAACGATPAQPVTVRLTSPKTGDALAVNQAVSIRGEVAGDGVAQVRVRINGQTYQQLPASQLSGVILVQWTPQAAGQQIIFLEAYDASNTLLARSDVVIANSVVATTPATPATPAAAPTTISIGGPVTPTVTVVETSTATAMPAPTSAPTPTVVSTVTQAAVPTSAASATIKPTSTPTPKIATATSGVKPTTQAISATPSITVLQDYDFVNLRIGPGTGYDIVGRLNKGQQATVIGRSADDQWWQVKVDGKDGKTAWVSGQLVQANPAAAGVAVVKVTAWPTFTPAPTSNASVTTTATSATATTTASITATVIATATVIDPNRPTCGAGNPDWGARRYNEPKFTFCERVPLDIVPNANPDPDVIVIHWDVYGDIKALELQMDPTGAGCGIGASGFRRQVNFKDDHYEINTRFLPTGSYKLAFQATMNDGTQQRWGNLNFCGKG